MSWYSEQIQYFPPAVRRVTLPEGTYVAGRFCIRHALHVSGRELYYLAQDIETGEEICLCELLPLQWCMPDETGYFVPYQEDAGMQWELIKNTAYRRIDRMSGEEDGALPELTALFEDRGTIWYAAVYHETRSLRQEMAEHIIAPDKAVSMLAPVMDTLAGLHDEGLYHGAITASSIRFSETGCELWDWNSNEGTADAGTDVRAISFLLWQMMTGETVYRSLTAASLPAVIRNALYNGMYDPEMTIAALWEQLHAVKPAARTKAGTPPERHAPKMLMPIITAVFCVLCIAVPLVLWHVRVREEKQAAIPVAVTKVADVSYALSEGELRMPELLSQTQEDAMQQLEEMGLRVILASREDNPIVPEGCVITQQPDAGTLMHAGDVVTLSLSDGWTSYVPDVCNLLIGEAKSELEALGFTVEYEEIISPGDAPGTVISQDAKPETKLNRDTVIHLTVSLGRTDLDPDQTATVGNYVGMDFEEAKEQLSDLFLYAMQTETIYDPDVPAGVIISQDIDEGEEVPQGTIINMTVSKGVQTTRVPGVLLMNANAARELLESAGLICMVCYVSDSHVMDCVLTQSVKEGTLVPVRSEVWLTASVGTESHVASTGGWTGGELPTFGEEETTEPEQETEPEPEQTDPPATEPPAEPEPQPTEPYVPPATEAPPVAEPPVPEPPQGDLTPPPMPVG